MADTLPTIEQIAEEHAPVKETPENEKPVEVKKEEPKEKKDFLAPKFAALTRKEREVREREQQAQRRIEEIEARARVIEEREGAIKAAKRPSDILKAHGLSYADVTADVLGSYEEPEADPIDEKLTPFHKQNEELKAQLKLMQDQLVQLQTDRLEQAQQAMRQEITSTAQSNGHELLLAVGDEAYTLVELVRQNYAQTHRKILPIKDACDKVEEYYVNAVSRLAETPKMKSRFAPPAPQAQSKPKPVVPATQERPKTLTQSLSQGTSATKPNYDSMAKQDAIEHLATLIKFRD